MVTGVTYSKSEGTEEPFGGDQDHAGESVGCWDPRQLSHQEVRKSRSKEAHPLPEVT